MKKTISLTLAVTLTCFSVSSLAKAKKSEEFDVAKMTCQELMDDEEHIADWLIWIDGYLSSESGDTIMSKESMESIGEHMGKYCAKHKKKTIMDAIKAYQTN